MSPIFIVGAPRSGTTLLATMLASHPHLSCGPETHFFPQLAANRTKIPSLLSDRHWPTQATDFVVSLSLSEQRIIDLFGLSAAQIQAYLATRKPSIQALLESVTVQQMRAQGKSRWAEKTPNHILHLDTIRRLYPAARMIRIIRDPRDSAYSIAQKLPWASDSPLENAYLIDEWYRRSTHFWQRDTLAYTLQYEALVMQPEATLRDLCSFIQEPYDPGMLKTQAAAKRTAPAAEPWKQQVGQGLDPSRCYAWKRRLVDSETRAVSAVCHALIADFQYSQINTGLKPIAAHYISYRFARSSRQTIHQLLDQGQLLVPQTPHGLPARSTLVYCDVPINGTNLTRSVKRFTHFLKDLLLLRWQGVNIQFSAFCYVPASEKNWLGKIAAVCLRHLGTRAELP